VGVSRTFPWEWQGRPIKVAYETLGTGRTVLLLLAFSTVSSREEMRPLAECLANQGCSCVLVDWPGFGESTRGRLDYGSRLFISFWPTSRPLSCRGPRRSLQPDTPPTMRLCLRAIGREYGHTPWCWRRPGENRSRRRW
jgi:pimeloyl-ACP methyl ester carboxylesterase